MSRRVNYRRRLLEAVVALIEDSPVSKSRARDLIRSCPPIPAFTVANIVWGPALSQLKDGDFIASRASLEKLERFLRGRSDDITRTYISHDFRTLMNEAEMEVYNLLESLLQYLDSTHKMPFEEAGREYDSRVVRIENVWKHLSSSSRSVSIFDNTLHYLVMQYVKAAASGIDLRMSRVKPNYFAPASPYSSISQPTRNPDDNYPPDASQTLVWAKRAMRALSGDGWLCIMWQLRVNALAISLI